jgi:tRNA dimethylallyltransferase
VLVIAGPTGAGKTAAAVALAARIPIEVVSADSRQVYRGLDAATGKPTAAERTAVRHHLVDVVDPDDRYHAARFRRDAAALVADVHARHRLPVVVGGTGLYIRALLQGLDPGPPADDEFRRELEALVERHGREALHRRLAAQAPEVARRLHPRDQVRVTRALERLRAGGPVADAGTWREAPGEYRTVYVGLTASREVLWSRLRGRVSAMVRAGLADEVRTLLARGYASALPALRGIGYREFIDVVQGRRGEEEAIRAMGRATVEYARRQLTWFRREPGIRWLDVEGAGGVEAAAAAIASMAYEEGLIA